MSKERLEEIKEIRRNMEEFVDSDGCVVDYPRYDELALLISDEGHLDYLIEQAELMQRFAKKNAELNVFLNKGKNVIDVAIDIIEKQSERVQELEETNKKNYWIAADFKFENLKLEQQNKRYREALEYYAEHAINDAYAQDVLSEE